MQWFEYLHKQSIMITYFPKVKQNVRDEKENFRIKIVKKAQFSQRFNMLMFEAVKLWISLFLLFTLYQVSEEHLEDSRRYWPLCRWNVVFYGFNGGLMKPQTLFFQNYFFIRWSCSCLLVEYYWRYWTLQLSLKHAFK